MRGTQVAAALVLVTVAGHASDLRAPPGASSCTGCHATGAAMGSLDGRPEAEIAALLAAYRAGERPATIMTRIAKGFSEPESRAIAAWFAARTAR
ncbi:c-type cytochrome [uncultured Methylobacterium sp.]|uniref:c-type cytochrome n=1 Tax=uncultured Methylobacterium sp. TaxID=157278 RepID=UPI0035C9CFF4